MKLSGAEILIKELIHHGVDVVFGYPGGAVLNIYDELYKNSDKIKNVLSAHEQGAAHAADGYARASGKTGVVISTSGPGATNLVTGIANAYLDSVPMVAITGNVATSLLGRDSFQEVDIVGITLPIVKNNFIVRDVKQLQKILREAFYVAQAGRKGTVLVDIPKDVQIQMCEYDENLKFSFPSKLFSNDFDVDEIAGIINKSERPYIYCGGGVLASNGGEIVQELSSKIKAPIGLSMMGISAIPTDFENNLGMVGMHGNYASNMAKNNSDLIIAVGVRFSDRATGSKSHYNKDKKVIHIDIDEAELDKNIGANYSICGNLVSVLEKIMPKIDEKTDTKWEQEVNSFKQKESNLSLFSGEFSPKNIIRSVNRFMSEDCVVATDVGQHQMWVMQYYSFSRPRTLLTSGGLGTMGYGLGAAVGGAIATGKQTVLFTGDGSFGMNLNELATVVSENLPIIIVIMNNGVLGMVRQWQRSFYGGRFSKTTLNRKTDFVKLAEAFGLAGYMVTTLDELEVVLQKNKDSNLPMLIDCRIDCDEKALPMIPPNGKYMDMIVK